MRCESHCARAWVASRLAAPLGLAAALCAPPTAIAQSHPLNRLDPAPITVRLDPAPITVAERSAAPCAAALVLALDVSTSVDATERRLQAEGLAAALTAPDVLDAILASPGGVMAAAFLWGDAGAQPLVAGWSRLDSVDAVARFAAAIAGSATTRGFFSTAIGEALREAARLHARNPVPCDRRIVDVSGDGVRNNGKSPNYYRKSGALAGLHVNGLVIRGETPDPLGYYERQVIQGPAAFVIDIDSYDDYETAMRRKLIRELTIAVGRGDADAEPG